MKEKQPDPVMHEIRRRIKESKLTQQQIGEKMGYAEKSARKSVSQLLNTRDPQISVLRRFSMAMNIALKTLLKL